VAVGFEKSAPKAATRRKSADVLAVKSTTLQKALRRRKLDFLSVAVLSPEVICSLIDYRPSPVVRTFHYIGAPMSSV
jgi:hypothetical protein